jgi:ubiquinone/menaquinone biosynthesis C-methylase UbiE
VTVQPRIAAAIEALDLQPSDRVLDIGFGPGVSLAAIAARLVDGTVTGIDRTSTSIARATTRLSAELATGKVALTQTSLAELSVEPATFDKAVAVNVNLFWTGPADAELSVLSQALRPSGTLVLAYDTTRPNIAPAATANLSRYGFTSEVVPAEALVIRAFGALRAVS